MQFRGKILRDGKVVLDPAVGDLRSLTPLGNKDWEGSLTVPPNVNLVAGSSYRLVLDDGRSADILIGMSSYNSAHLVKATFIISNGIY